MSQQINLFDESLRPRRPPLDLRLMLVLFIAVLAALVGSFELGRRQLATLEAERAALETQSKGLQTRLTALGGVTRAPDRALTDEIARLETQVRHWEQLLERLKGAGIGNTEGHARFLEALARQHADGVWLREIRVGEGGADFTLKGRALRPDLLVAYMKQLNHEDALRGRGIGQMDVSETPATSEPSVPRASGKAEPAAEAAAKAAAKAPELRFVEFTVASSPRTVDSAVPKGAGAGGAR